MAARKRYLAVAAAVATVATTSTTADAAVFICVPTSAGAAVTSGGADGSSCGAAKPVQLPESRDDQATMASVLPYLSFKASGIGGKPTVQVRGANLQLVNGSGATTSVNGTGNLVLGYDEYPGTQTGSHNLVTGQSNTFTSYGSFVGGTNNRATAPWTTVGGYFNTASSSHSTVAAGYSNTASNFAAFVGGGHDNTAKGEASAILGGSRNGAEGTAAAAVGGFANTARGTETAVLGGNQNSAAGKWSTLAGGKLNITNALNGTGDGTHYWARVDANGMKLADSGTLRGGYSIETYHYSGGWTLVWLRGLDVAKCSVSAEPDATSDAEIGYRYQAGEYVYVQTKRAGQPVDGIGVSVSLDCANPAS